MNNSIGVMQGRLLPKYQGRYQAHPVGYWQEEFPIAKKLGLDCIEFILDYYRAKENPLLTDRGIYDIKALIDQTGVKIKTICADYFMEAPLHSKDRVVSEKSQQVLIKLLNNVADLGATDVVIPCVDHSSLNSQEAVDQFVHQLEPIVVVAEKKRVNLSLETD
ncbi:sugar phosphate isomerase/epimerase, partial [Deltaproteobacteria bacterium]|nr:sugar phosphate isomerase/epimerase [Deltaproteobacteria bacterium]